MGKDVLGKTKAGEQEVGGSYLERIFKSGRFYTTTFTAEGRRFFTFAEIGDELEGYLQPNVHGNSHLYRSKSFQIQCYSKTENGITIENNPPVVEEFFANWQLQQIFKRNNLVGKFVRIVFIGRQKSNWGGHAAKVYRVFLQKGVMTNSESEVS